MALSRSDEVEQRAAPAGRPFYEVLDAKCDAMLTDNGQEFCGIQQRHPYEVLLAMQEIQRRSSKVRSLRTNCFVQRMNRTSSCRIARPWLQPAAVGGAQFENAPGKARNENCLDSRYLSDLNRLSGPLTARSAA